MKKIKIITAILLIAFFINVLPSATGEAEAQQEEKKDFIKWVDFNVSKKAMNEAMEMDIKYHGSEIEVNWIELLAYLGAKYGGDFSKYKTATLNELVDEIQSGTKIEEFAEKYSTYNYFLEAYSAALGEFVGEYRVQISDEKNPEKLVWEDRYGLKAFSPIAKGFDYHDYDDFGAGRNYGYARKHLGHDMFGLTGTPICAIESGTVEVMGWNQYGGWRIGIRSFDGLRYYYYAHLRQNRPFNDKISEGEIVKAGDVIGYMGHTGYSTKENVNNIKETHLHVGLQLIFDESQKEGANEIWIDMYHIANFLRQNSCQTYRVDETKEFYREYDFEEPNLQQATK